MNDSKYKIKVNKTIFSNTKNKKTDNKKGITPEYQRKIYNRAFNVLSSSQRIKPKKTHNYSKLTSEENMIKYIENNKYFKPILSSNGINKKLKNKCVGTDKMKNNARFLLINYLHSDYNDKFDFSIEQKKNKYDKNKFKIKNDIVINTYKTIEHKNTNNYYNDFIITSSKFYGNSSLMNMNFNSINQRKKINSLDKFHNKTMEKFNKKENNNNESYNKCNISVQLKKNNYEYHKEKFFFYREKLFNEFLKYILNIINKYILKYYNIFIQNIKFYIKNSKKINISNYSRTLNNSLWETNKNYKNQNSNYLIKKDNMKHSMNSEEIKDNTKYIPFHNKINRNKRNTSFFSYRSRNLSIFSSKSLLLRKTTLDKFSSKKNNITNKKDSSQYVYIKKLNINKKNNLSYITKGNTPLTNSKIIDINIDLGKPIRQICDISSLESKYFTNNNNSTTKKNLKISFNSINKKHKRNERKNLILPNKKFLEEDENFNYNLLYSEKKNDVTNIKSIDTKIINSNINEKNQYFMKKNKYKIILVKNIITPDNLLFITIKYIYISINENNKYKNFKNKDLIISNEFSFLCKKNCKSYFEFRHKKFDSENRSFLYKKIDRNNKNN